jgi:hypothetical protein
MPPLQVAGLTQVSHRWRWGVYRDYIGSGVVGKFRTRKHAYDFMRTCNALEGVKKRIADAGGNGEYVPVRYVLVDMTVWSESESETDDNMDHDGKHDIVNT